MLPNEFKFEHGYGKDAQLFHAKRVGDDYIVSWRKDEGHSADGEIDWEPSQVERYIEEGAWRLVEDKAPEPEFYGAHELDELPQNTPVKVVVAYETFEVGQIVYRNKESRVDDELSCKFSEKPDGGGERWLMNCHEVAKVVPNACVETPLPETPAAPEDLGVYRPDLDTRKVGKVRVELVDDGFPLALREIAKVMTWAQTAKGYKDHDWQNLPNAEQALAAAASRHRTDHIKQRIVDGENIVDCVDGESKLLHKAHEAFGVLAQLELMLRGEFE